MPEYITVKWNTEVDTPDDDEKLERMLGSFNRMEEEKLEWFTNSIQRSNLFIIGDPVHIFRRELANAVMVEAIWSRKYHVSRESLEEMKRNLKKKLEEKFKCVVRIKIPLLDTSDPEEWDVAKRTGNLRQILIVAKKIIDLKVITVTFGDIQ